MKLPRFPLAAVLAAALLSAAALPASPPSVEEDSASSIERLTREIEALRLEIQRLTASSADSARLQELERKVEALAREIERLRSGDESPVAGEGRFGLGPAASKVYAVRQGVSLGGYGEMLLQAPRDEREDGSASGARRTIDFVRAILYAGYKFDDKLLFNSEIEFEHASTGQDGEVAVEFAYLDWLLRPELNLRAGLILVPMGFLNELHEPPSWLGARRPLTERVILPSTWRENGAGVFGESGRWSWRAYLVNGLDASGFTAQGLRGGKQDGARALAESFALVGRLDFRPTLSTLVGGSFYAGNSAQGRAGFSAPTRIFELHGEVRARGLDVRALWARASVGDAAAINAASGLEGAASVGSRLEGGYLQVGYDVLSRHGRTRHSLTPYLRLELVDTQARVPAGFRRDPASDRRLWTAGAAWKPHHQVVIKADWEEVHDQARRGVDQFNLQLGYIF